MYRKRMSILISILVALLISAQSACSPWKVDMNTIAEDYVLTCFRLQKYVPGLVDAYFGPLELKQRAEADSAYSLEQIEIDIFSNLRLLTEAGSSARTAFLSKQFKALKALTEIELGYDYTFMDEVKLIYDIEPKLTPLEEYESALQTIDKILPGSGPLTDRIDRYNESLVIPPEKVKEIFLNAAEHVRGKAKSFLPLPENESFTIELVTDKPWSGYNWFKGNASSLIELNVDLPRRVDQVLPLMTHEGYPGHHTELTLREKLMYREKGYLEYSVYPLFSPQSVISEGIAEMAIETVMNTDEQQEYIRDVIMPEAGIDEMDFDVWEKLGSAMKQLDSVPSDAAIMLLHEGKSESEVLDFLRKYGMMSEGYAEKRLEFIKHYRGYIFTYNYGYTMLKDYVEGKDQRTEFQNLISDFAWPSKFIQK